MILLFAMLVIIDILSYMQDYDPVSIHHHDPFFGKACKSPQAEKDSQ